MKEYDNRMFEKMISILEIKLKTDIRLCKYLNSYTVEFFKREFLDLKEINDILNLFSRFNLKLERIGYSKISECIFIILKEMVRNE